MKRFILSSVIVAGLLSALTCSAGDRDLERKSLTASSNSSIAANSADAGKIAAKAVYKVQILALCCPIPMQATVFHRMGELKVNESVFNNQYIYTVGEYKSREKALECLARLKKSYQSAFVVEFINGSRIKR